MLDVRGKSLVSEWAKNLPEWLEVITVSLPPHDAELLELDLGERAAIVLAGEMGANLRIDERRGRAVAQARGLSGERADSPNVHRTETTKRNKHITA